MKRKLLSFALVLFLVPFFSNSFAGQCDPQVIANAMGCEINIMQPSKFSSHGGCTNICASCEVYSSICGEEIYLGWTYDG